SDCRISSPRPDGRMRGQNIHLKTGLLCPGTIFGRVGNVIASRDFILDFKASVHSVEDDDVGFWHRFEEFARRYSYPPHAEFEILLSTSAYGEPRFAHVS